MKLKQQLAKAEAYKLMLKDRFRNSKCHDCMGCVQMERESFRGKYECENYRKYER